MIIHRIHIRRFRKLGEQVLECRPGLNVVYGPNDAGKSTLHLAFSAVLYPVRPSEVKTYGSWGEDDPGEITVEFEAGGRAYRLHKDLRSRKARLESGEERIEDPRTIEQRIGELLGLQSLSLFRATAHISQWDLAGVQKEQQEIGTRLARIVTGGDADAARVLALLEDKIRRLEVGLARPSKTPGPLKRDQDRLQLLAADRQRLAQDVDRIERAAVERERLAAGIADLRAQVASDEALLQANRRRLDLDARLARASARAADLQAVRDRVGQAAREAEAADREVAQARAVPGVAAQGRGRRPGAMWDWLLGVAALLAGIAGIAGLWAGRGAAWGAGALAFAFLITAALAAARSHTAAARHRAVIATLEVAHRRDAARRLLDALLGGRTVEDLGAQHRQALLELGAIQAQREDPDLVAKQLDPEAFQRCESASAVNRQRLAESEAALLRLEGRLDTRLPHEDLARVEEEIGETSERLGRHQRLVEVLRLTRDVLFEAHRSTIVPGKAMLEERASGYLAALSGGAYERIAVDEHSLAPRVWVGPPRGWADVASREVGSGAVDQCYLALRLALVDVLCQGRRPPLFLDDPFLAYDERRMDAALRLMGALARDRQIFLLTCRTEYHRYADHLITLGEAGEPRPAPAPAALSAGFGGEDPQVGGEVPGVEVPGEEHAEPAARIEHVHDRGV